MGPIFQRPGPIHRSWLRSALAGILMLGTHSAARSQVAPAQPPLPRASSPLALPDSLPPGPEMGPAGRPLPLLGGGSAISPGLPPREGRPLPGGVLDPGASGPGVGRPADEDFLGGALDPRTGWPFVFLDHFQPRTDRVANLWLVQTRDCPQEMGTNPWPRLKILQFDDRGNLVPRSPAQLFAQTLGRPVLIQTHGSLVTADEAIGELLWTHSWLQRNDAMRSETVVIEFDWPSQRVYQNDSKDINEKGRRAYVAGYHLAKFVQAFPSGSRVCILGQSYGGRVVPSALHLLGGGCLNSQDHDPPVRLAGCRSDIDLHAILIEGASDHHWLNPNERFERALHTCGAMLNLYNRRDEALRLYPLLRRSGHHRALGRVGLSNSDFAKLGPLATRYQEHDIHDLLGNEHTLLDAVANRQIARWIAPYLWAPDPGASPAYPNLNTPRPPPTSFLSNYRTR
jgi:hypothetical protein